MDKEPKQTELVKRDELPVDRQPDGLSLRDAWSAVVKGDMTAERLAVMKDLLAMNSEKEFAFAFNALQAEMPVIVASTPIPNRGKYEKFEDVMRQIGPFLARNGFTVSFTMDFKENRILETCHLTHIGGFTRSNSFAVRVSGKADSETQADCKAATTAKRNALCNALNIVIRQDCLNAEDDAAIEGGPVSGGQAFELERRAKETNSNITAFLKFAGASSFKEIPASKYDMLDELLRRKEKR